MNKWYRLGQEFSKKYSGKDVYDFLRKTIFAIILQAA